MHPPAEFLLNFQQFLPPTVAIRDAPDFKSPQTIRGTDVLKA